jgi:actin-like ATPase involved in cell morphogenesis
MARGLDVGTCFLVGAKKQNENTDGETVSIRDAFVDIENQTATKNMLKMSKMKYIEDEDSIYIVGDQALTIANMFKKEIRRPLKAGVISAGETESEKILYLLLQSVLGEPDHEGEICFYSVPAPSVDTEMDVVYHEAMFRKLVEQHGFKAEPMNEAAAVVFANCQDTMFTGLGTSFGAGMVNTALLFQTMMGMQFSTSRSGDWIDESAAKAVGKTASQMMSIKEKGVNLLDPSEGDPKEIREREAIIIYYKNLISYTVDHIKKEFKTQGSSIQLNDPIPWVISGGTTQPKNFLEFFKQEFSKVKDFPFEISEIRMANDPLADVAKGLLIAAINYEE